MNQEQISKEGVWVSIGGIKICDGRWAIFDFDAIPMHCVVGIDSPPSSERQDADCGLLTEGLRSGSRLGDYSYKWSVMA